MQFIINTFNSVEYSLRSNHLFLRTNKGLILTLAARDDLILAELVADQGFKSVGLLWKEAFEAADNESKVALRELEEALPRKKENSNGSYEINVFF